jgi:hypothetical protein
MRMRTSVIALLAIAILACIVFGWFSRPLRVKLISYPVFGESLPRRVEDSNAQHAAKQLDEASALLKSGEFLKTVLESPSVAQLRLINGHRSLPEWLASQLSVDFDNSANAVYIWMILPKSQEADGLAILDAVSAEMRSRIWEAEAAPKVARRALLAEQLRVKSHEMENRLTEFNKLADGSSNDEPKAEQARQSFESLKSEIKELGGQLQAMDIEAEAPRRIKLVQTAVVELGRW